MEEVKPPVTSASVVGCCTYIQPISAAYPAASASPSPRTEVSFTVTTDYPLPASYRLPTTAYRPATTDHRLPTRLRLHQHEPRARRIIDHRRAAGVRHVVRAEEQRAARLLRALDTGAAVVHGEEH